ncbi:MAG: CFI-box-CTERM domain-containing protein, partial [Burkholderiaceae bacterium]
MKTYERDRFVSASELAQLGYCERKIQFDRTFGERETYAQRQARKRGNRAHKSFYEESRRIARNSATRGKCFIATYLLGECKETSALRAFRDLYLRRSVFGRWIVGRYYKVSPWLCRHAGGRRAAQVVLRPV